MNGEELQEVWDILIEYDVPEHTVAVVFDRMVSIIRNEYGE